MDTGDKDLGGEQDYENGNVVNQELEKKNIKELGRGEETAEKMFLPPSLKLEKGAEESK